MTEMRMRETLFDCVKWGFAALLVVTLFHYGPALAQACTGSECGIEIGGTDKSGGLKALTDIAKTVQVFAIKYAAPVVGSLLVFFGIYKIATREAVTGAIALIGGGGLLFLPKVIEQLSKLVA